MKKGNWIITGILTILILFSGCTKIYISVISKSHDINADKTKSAIIVGTDGIALHEFTQTFNKRYQHKREFINDYVSFFKDKLLTASIFNQLNADTCSQWSLVKSFAGSREDFKIIDSLFTNCHADYIINISNFEVSNRMQAYTSGGGTNSTMSTYTTEYCVVNAQIQIIDAVKQLESDGEIDLGELRQGTRR